MAILLKIRWEIKLDREGEFHQNQERLCAVMSSDHPGVICYHVDYPAPLVSEWIEIYANDAVFKAHLDNPKGQGPLGKLIEACNRITCRCWGDPNSDSRSLLAAFKPSFHETASGSFILHPRADRASSI
jgi:hypothetical protein